MLKGHIEQIPDPIVSIGNNLTLNCINDNKFKLNLNYIWFNSISKTPISIGNSLLVINFQLDQPTKYFCVILNELNEQLVLTHDININCKIIKASTICFILCLLKFISIIVENKIIQTSTEQLTASKQADGFNIELVQSIQDFKKRLI